MDADTRKQRLATALDALRDLAADYAVAGGDFAMLAKLPSYRHPTVAELIAAAITELDAWAQAEPARAVPIALGDEVTVQPEPPRFGAADTTPRRETLVRVTSAYIHTRRTYRVSADGQAHTLDERYSRGLGTGDRAYIIPDDVIRIQRCFAPKRAAKKR